MADAALSLFEQFREGGIARIRLAIESNQAETTHLDFKENRDKSGSLPTLTDAGRQNLGKAISAFANVSGGVLVWGIEAKDKKANADSAIPDVATFLQSLYTHTGGITDPSVLGVEHIAIEDPDRPGWGYAATYIPESAQKPHQCVATESTTNYYMRVGSNVEPMPHAFVRALMMEKARPVLRLSPIRLSSWGSLSADFTVTIQNTGASLALSVAIAVASDPRSYARKEGMNGFTYSNERILIEADAKDWDAKDWDASLFTMKPGQVIYPGVAVEAVAFRYTYSSEQLIMPLDFHIWAFAEGFRSKAVRIGYSREEVLETMGLVRE